MGSHAVRRAQCRDVDRADPDQLRGIRGVDYANGRTRRIRDKQPATECIVCGDLRTTGVERAELLEVERRVAGRGQTGDRIIATAAATVPACAMRDINSSDVPCGLEDWKAPPSDTRSVAER